MKYIGIVGRSPKPVPGPVQVDRFERLERFVGRLEGQSTALYPALYAAFLALANGVDRVIFAGVPDEDWGTAVARLFQSDPLPLVVAPGGPAEILAPAFRALPFTRTSTLWVDEPVDESDGRVRVASQLVDVTSPYRRTPEPLSAAALIGPLHLGVTDALNGRFSTPDPPGLLTLDPRGRLVLTQPLDPPGPPLPPRPENEVSAAAFRIDRAIAEMVEPILLTENVSDALYQRLEREATAILEGFRTRGDVTSYIVRCNAETSEGADGPVIEVRIREPKRVDELVLRCHRM